LQARHEDERGQLQRQQQKLFARFVAAIDLTGQTRRRRVAAGQELKERQRRERRELAGHVREARAIQAEAVQARYRPMIDEIRRERRQQVGALKERQRDEMRREDGLLQTREAERDQDRAALQ
jgi:hypothetical protein